MIKLTVFIIILFFTSCVSFVERTGRFLDGSASAQKKTAVYSNEILEAAIVQNKSEERSLLIAVHNYPMMKLRGSEPDGSGFFHLTSLEYLGGSTHGWNEFTMEILGDGLFTLGDTANLILTTEIDKVQIVQGRIHRYDTRITGSEALVSLRNRQDRIASLAEFMKNMQPENTPHFTAIKEFDEYWKPLLLPETVSARKRPAAWLQDADEADLSDVFARAEDIRWNTSYTERVFPEELISVRNSGTLLRDWEEALPWIYMYYMWDQITETLLQLQVLY